MPGTFVGLFVFVAALGPGYLFVRLLESLDPRRSHSALTEAVEMAVIGSAATSVSLIAVVGVGDLIGQLRTEDLVDHGLGVLSGDTWRWLAAFVSILVVSYGLAVAAAYVVKRKFPSDVKHDPGGTAWNQAFEKLVPSRDHVTIGTVYLRDGRAFTGQIKVWTAHLDGSRELLLTGRPLVSTADGSVRTRLDEEFVLLREEDVLFIAGRYHNPREVLV